MVCTKKLSRGHSIILSAGLTVTPSSSMTSPRTPSVGSGRCEKAMEELIMQSVLSSLLTSPSGGHVTDYIECHVSML